MPTRIEKLRDLLAQQSVDCLLVTGETDVRYLSGFTGDSSYLLISGSRAAILSDRRYETQIEQECGDLEAFVRGPERTMTQLVGQAVEDFSVKTVGLDANDISWGLAEGFRSVLANQTLVPANGLVPQLRQIKEASEIETIREAVRIAERTFLAIRATLRHGQTELEIAHNVEHWIRHFGGEGCGFATIAAIGPNAALPHAQPGQRRIGDDPALLLDWGAKYKGYTSDLTRMTAIGAPSAEMAEIYPVVLEAQMAAISAIGPGVALKTVDAAARDVIADAGFGDYFSHGLGHGIGLQVHESPRISAITEGELQTGMIVTVEPGIYLPGKLGVRIEDDVLVTENGYEVLSSLPKGLDDCTVIL
ncbi:putative peptidase [Rosistilla ulvae]|uniref:Putative peptidase n=1 Tax=Rosistilla ulvae TaxID=1930277 RepID=A0A517M3E1_9BACT|nr:Xaa-Pro peptidase family protein [Rosistilla ulvae]QDS89393.1 putative peptidase [Rosistilla ulvae]